MKRPWMPLYIADFIRDTTHVGPLIKGAYLCLIMHYWNHGGLPDNETQLRIITGLTSWEYRTHRDTLKAFFFDGWRHKRIDRELAHVADVSNKRSAIAAARQEKLRVQTECKDSAIAPAIADTLHTSHFTKKEEVGSADAPTDKVVSFRRYVFEGRIVRLEKAAFDKWQSAYAAIPDLNAELQSADDYYTANPPKDGSWFFPVSNWLKKANADALEKRKRRLKEMGPCAENGWSF